MGSLCSSTKDKTTANTTPKETQEAGSAEAPTTNLKDIQEAGSAKQTEETMGNRQKAKEEPTVDVSAEQASADDSPRIEIPVDEVWDGEKGDAPEVDVEEKNEQEKAPTDRLTLKTNVEATYSGCTSDGVDEEEVVGLAAETKAVMKKVTKAISRGDMFPNKFGPFMVPRTTFVDEDFYLVEMDEGDNKNPFFLMYREVFKKTKTGKILEKLILNFPLWGQMSPAHPVTMPKKTREKINIPMSASFYVWAYPLDIEWRSDYVNKLVQEGVLHEPDVVFLRNGGYMYFDDNFKVVAVNAFAASNSFEQTAELTSKKQGIRFGNPEEFPSKFIEQVARDDRFKRVNVAKLRARGARYYAWLRPNEELVAPDRSRKSFGPHGGFAFLFQKDLTEQSGKEVKNLYFPCACYNPDHCKPAQVIKEVKPWAFGNENELPSTKNELPNPLKLGPVDSAMLKDMKDPSVLVTSVTGASDAANAALEGSDEGVEDIASDESGNDPQHFNRMDSHFGTSQEAMIQHELQKKKTVSDMRRQHSQTSGTTTGSERGSQKVNFARGEPLDELNELALPGMNSDGDGGLGGGLGGLLPLPSMKSERTTFQKAFGLEFINTLVKEGHQNEMLVYFLASLPAAVLKKISAKDIPMAKDLKPDERKKLSGIFLQYFTGAERQFELRGLSKKIKERVKKDFQEKDFDRFYQLFEDALLKFKDVGDGSFVEFKFRVLELKRRFEYHVKADKQISAELESRIKERNWMKVENRSTFLVIRDFIEGYNSPGKRGNDAFQSTRTTNNVLANEIIDFYRPELRIPYYETPHNTEFKESDQVLILPEMHRQKQAPVVGKIHALENKHYFHVVVNGKKQEIHKDRIRKPFNWICPRDGCKNSNKEYWRDIYPDRKWVTCLKCGLVAVKGQNREGPRYIKRHKVRESNFGAIYYGYDNEAQRKVAIKENDKECVRTKRRKSNGQKVAEDVVQECRFHSKLCPEGQPRPPGILQYYGEYEDEKNLHIVLEWADKDELFEYVVGKFKEPAFLRDQSRIKKWQVEMQDMFYEICLGLKVLHDQNIVHRDLSLENVLLVSNPNPSKGEPKVFPRICDFGLTTDYKSAHRDSVGKLSYMSPECHAGGYDGKANDIWCLGIMLFMMMIGAPPYQRIGDRAYQYLIRGENDIRYLLKQYKRYYLVPDSAFQVLFGIFKLEDDRISIDKILKTDYCLQAKKRSFWIPESSK